MELINYYEGKVSQLEKELKLEKAVSFFNGGNNLIHVKVHCISFIEKCRRACAIARVSK